MKLLETVEDFVEYIESKPEDKWCKHLYTDDNGNHCILGWLDKDFHTKHNDDILTNIRVNLFDIIAKRTVYSIIYINDDLPEKLNLSIKDTWLKVLNEVK